jgi:hypothetical protein
MFSPQGDATTPSAGFARLPIPTRFARQTVLASIHRDTALFLR